MSQRELERHARNVRNTSWPPSFQGDASTIPMVDDAFLEHNRHPYPLSRLCRIWRVTGRGGCDPLVPVVIRHTDHSCVDYVRVADNGILDFTWRDILAATLSS